MLMLAHARIAHHSRGRTRLKVRAKRGDAGYFAGVCRELAEHEAVEHVDANPSTSSLVVWHRDDADIATLGAFARDRQLFELDPEPPEGTLADGAAALLRDIDAGIGELSARRADLRSVLLGAFVAIGLVQMLRGRVLAPASTLFWYAFELVGSVPYERREAPRPARGLHR
jgi:hypothetical protein